jgi:hypothetical protein
MPNKPVITKEKVVICVVPTKVVEPIVEIIAQPTKPTSTLEISLHYLF